MKLVSSLSGSVKLCGLGLSPGRRSSVEERLAGEHGLSRRRRQLANGPPRRQPWLKHRWCGVVGNPRRKSKYKKILNTEHKFVTLYVINSAQNIFIYSLVPLKRSRFTRHSANAKSLYVPQS